MKITDILIALFVMVIWGLNFAVAKIALGEFPPILMTGLRFSRRRGGLGARFAAALRDLAQIAGLAVTTLGGIHFPADIFRHRAARRIDLGDHHAVAGSARGDMALAALFLRDRLGWRRILGMAVAFSGVVVIAGAPRLQASHLGLALLLAAAFVFALTNIQVKWIGPIDPFALNGWLALFATLELFPMSRLLEGPAWPFIVAAGWRGWSGVLYMSLISTIVGYGLWVRFVGRYTVNQTMPFLLLVPLFAVLSGLVLTGDSLTPDIVIGGLMTIAGVAVIIVRRPANAAGRVPR